MGLTVNPFGMKQKVLVFEASPKNLSRAHTHANNHEVHACADVCVPQTLTRPANIWIGAQRLLQISGQQLQIGVCNLHSDLIIDFLVLFRVKLYH